MAPRSNKETKPHQFRNLTFTDHKPKFLANIDAALRGNQPGHSSGRRRTDEDGQTTEIIDPNRPAIPVRAKFEEEDEDDGPQIVKEDDKADALGRLSDEDSEQDDDAPVVVVVKEGRDLTKEEVEAERVRIRDHPDQPSALPTSSRPTIQASLLTSSNAKAGSSNKRNMEQRGDRTSLTVDPDDNGWSALVKRTKGDKPSMVSTVQEEREKAKDREVQKKEKKAALKAKNKKAKNLMSFS
ncbi:hypothetical protein CROQUDRAFT_674495 [Cronartium quercuum f. sp. fusiforme G11]|uniref:DUF4604 domain-containing protein n=1 Tax=Cronartium quercuum f. sp. fusiforme G11 TaxID=708437 RepID=A0A9P6N6P3_9BASI|nr:hypothetical protein CROQUDRAFT_674495 [Cronartium quercuum f. sp. fusiforme G11]